MSKELLEFLGGLFALLAALVPIIRRIWRVSRRRVSIKTLVFIALPIINLAVLILGFIGFYLGWKPSVQVGIFLFYLVSQVTLFQIDKTPMKRADVAAFVLGVAVSVMFINEQYHRLQPERMAEIISFAKSLLPLISTTPTPTPAATPPSISN